MSRRLRLAAVFTAATLATSSLSAQGSVDPIFTQLNHSTRVHLMALMDSATNMGLPAELLRNLALQGKARNIPEKQILQTVRGRFAELQRAQRVLGRTASSSDLDAAAGAFRAKFSDTDIAQFRKERPDRSMGVVLTVLTDLVNSRGIPMDEATSSMLRVWKGGATDDEINRLWERIGQDILNGTNSRDAFQNHIRSAIPPGRPPET